MLKNTDTLLVPTSFSHEQEQEQPEQQELTQPASLIEAKTVQIKQLLRRTARDIQEIGQALSLVKSLLPHGGFSQWLAREFEWSDRQAQRFMQVARAFGEVALSGLPIMPSALYLLSAPSVSDTVREEAIRRASLGEEITFNLARELVASSLYFDPTSVVVEGTVITTQPEVQQLSGGAASWDFHEELITSPFPQARSSEVTPALESEEGLRITTQATSANPGNSRPEFRVMPLAQMQPGSSKRAAYTSDSFHQSQDEASDEALGLEFVPPDDQADTSAAWEGLGFASSDKTRLAGLGLSEVALLSIAKLDTAYREQVARLLLEHPEISGKKLRRLLSQLRQGELFEEARDEALGWVNGKPVYASSSANPNVSNLGHPESLSQEEHFSVISQNLLTSASCTRAALAQLDILLSATGETQVSLSLAQTQAEWADSLARLTEVNLVEQLKLVLVTRLLSEVGTQRAEAKAARPTKWSDQVLQASLTRFLQTF